MKQNENIILPQCPMEVTLNIIDGKWKIFILWHLGERTLRFNELRRILPHVTQKMLTQQLRELESAGMINRKIYAQVPPKVEYSLTESGKSLQPILKQLCQWGKEHSTINQPSAMTEQY